MENWVCNHYFFHSHLHVFRHLERVLKQDLFLCNGNQSSSRQSFVKRHKAAIQRFTAVKNLQATIREKGVNGFEYQVFKFLFLHFMNFLYFKFKLVVVKYFPLRSNMKDYWRSVADCSIPTCLYLIQMYTLNSSSSLIFVNLCS